MAEKTLRRILHYSLVRPIGSGGMATVYEAIDEKLLRSAAVKILHPHLASDASAVERFKREALSAAKLVHPNIVQVYDYFEQDGDRCIALEFVPGTDAESAVRKHGALGFKNALAIMYPVAEALRIAHVHGMIHRDIKPSNIMIRPDKRVMLTDFGLVKGSLDPTITIDNAVAGTPAFMAPEQISGKNLSPSADLYAWAVSFHYILTGTLPYKESEFVALIGDIKTAKTSVDEKILSAIPGKYAGIIRRCLLPDPADRPKDAGELIKLLEPIPQETAIEEIICCSDHIDREISAYVTERTISKTVIARSLFRKAGIILAILAFLSTTAFVLIFQFLGKSTNRQTDLKGQFSDTTITDSINSKIQTAQNDTTVSNGQKVQHDKKLARSNLKNMNTAMPYHTADSQTTTASSIPDSGSLFVFSEPWSNIEIDGVHVGKTPLEAPVRFTAGKRILKLHSEFTEEFYDTVVIAPNSVTRKRYKLTLKPAYRQ